jgi:hypothetical protein
MGDSKKEKGLEPGRPGRDGLARHKSAETQVLQCERSTSPSEPSIRVGALNEAKAGGLVERRQGGAKGVVVVVLVLVVVG